MSEKQVKMNNSVIHGDALEIVRDMGEFDYLITDPPYLVTGGTASRSLDTVQKYQEMNRMASASFIMAVMRDVIKAKKFACWIFCDFRYMSVMASRMYEMGLTKQYCLVWDKQAFGLGRTYRRGFELILHAANYSLKSSSTKDIFQVKHQRGQFMSKPPEIVQYACKEFPKGRVLDPFCGGGGLLAGAKRLGWDILGIDIDENSVDVANQRLSEVTLEHYMNG